MILPDRPLGSLSVFVGLCVGVSLLFASCFSMQVQKGDQHALGGEWDQAVAAYREALKKAPFDAKIQAKLDAARVHAGAGHYVQGRLALDEHRLADALREFKQALALDPSHPDHHEGMADAMRLKEARDQLDAAGKLIGLGRPDEALAAYERAVELDPSLTQALEGITQLTKQQRAEKSLAGSTQPITLRFQHAKLKEVFEILARTAGVNVIFDKEVRDDPITIFVKDLPFDEALNLILSTNNLLTQRIGSDTLLVMPNSKQKQAQYQDLLLRTFYLAHTKAKDAVNLVRTMLDSKKIYVDEKINAIVIRDEPAKLQLAERMLFAIDRREPEVVLDLEVLEVNRTKSLKYGLNFAKQAGVGVIPTGGSGGISTSPTQFTFQQLTSIGPGSYLFRLPASVLIDFFKQDSDAKTLASPKLRVLNNKAASINIGDKQPILLSTTNVLPGQAATGAIPTTSTVTSIEFKDTGVKLTVEPSINLLDEVTLKLKVEVTRLGDQVTLQASPEIKQFKFGTRSAETTLSLKDDETVVLAGLIQDEERKTRSSVPLLGDIPLLGQLFTSTSEDVVETEVVLTLTPHVVRSMGAPPIVNQAMWSGTENVYATTQLFPPRAMHVSHEVPTTAPASRQTGADGTPAFGGVSSQLVGGVTTAQSPPLNGAAATTAPAESVAHRPSPVTLRPVEVAATIAQEFRLDVLTREGHPMTEATATVSYDPKQIEFRRVGPGAAAISARATDGQVVLTIRRQGGADQGDTVVAMLFFQAKATGDAMVTLQATVGGAATPDGPIVQESVIVHVQ